MFNLKFATYDVKKMKLTQLNNVEMRQNEMQYLIGAKSCGCGCHGSSNTHDNYSANWYKGYSTSIGGGNKRCASTGDEFSKDNFN